MQRFQLVCVSIHFLEVRTHHCFFYAALNAHVETDRALFFICRGSTKFLLVGISQFSLIEISHFLFRVHGSLFLSILFIVPSVTRAKSSVERLYIPR